MLSSVAHKNVPFLVALFLIAVSMIRVIDAYTVTSPTWDEPAHIARGVQWLQAQEYSYGGSHPPLGQIFVAIGPTILGAEYSAATSRWQEGFNILFTEGTESVPAYISSARLGVMPFILILFFVVYQWSSRISGPWGGVLGLYLCAFTPLVLAHSGVATNDIAGAALSLLSLYLMVLWFEKPSLVRALLIGATVGLAILSKLSSILYLAIGAILILLAEMHFKGFAICLQKALLKRILFNFAAASFVAAILIWAMYFFSLSNFLGDVQGLREHNARGHLSSFLGSIGKDGWWQYFPVALFFTTPISFLALLAWSIFPALNSGRAHTFEKIPLVMALTVIALAMLSSINIGTRHVLLALPLFAIYLSWATVHYIKSRTEKIFLLVVLLGFGMESMNAHPRYLSYFNGFAGDRPENIIVNSNLDWGQDLYLLRETLKRRKIENAFIAYNGSFPPQSLIPEARLQTVSAQQLCAQLPDGWVIISISLVKRNRACRRIEAIPEVEKVGDSILLFQIRRKKS